MVSQVASYIRAVNDIYDKVDFSGIQLINFKVKSLRVSFRTVHKLHKPLSSVLQLLIADNTVKLLHIQNHVMNKLFIEILGFMHHSVMVPMCLLLGVEVSHSSKIS